MAAIMGKDGQVATNASGGSTLLGFIDTWSLNVAHDIEEVTAYNAGTVESKAYEYALQGSTGTCSGTLDSSDTEQTAILDDITATITPTKYEMKITLTSGDVLTGTVLATSIDVGSTVQGKASFSMAFTTDGTWTRAAS